jgi:CelD/BcsL family acetyltransferase involved in cellulose biosynthesis
MANLRKGEQYLLFSVRQNRTIMKIEVHTSDTVFDELKNEWDNLIDPLRAESIFLIREWQRLWWKHLGQGTLIVLTCRDDASQLLGIAPWFIDTDDKLRTIRTIGCSDVADYLDVLIKPGAEDLVWAGLIAFLLSDASPQWDRIDLCNLPLKSRTLAALPAIARHLELQSQVDIQDHCPIIELPQSFDECLASLSRTRRQSLRHKRRMMADAGAKWHKIGADGDIDPALGLFCRLMAASHPDKAAFLKRPGMESFFLEMGRRMLEGRLMELCFLTIEGAPIAAVWQFAYGDSVMFYNSGWSPQFAHLSPGIVLLSHCIEDAIQRGFRRYDFLRGTEGYKYRLGGVNVPVYNLIVRRK